MLPCGQIVLFVHGQVLVDHGVKMKTKGVESGSSSFCFQKVKFRLDKQSKGWGDF